MRPENLRHLPSVRHSMVSIHSGRMRPENPGNKCNDYVHSRVSIHSGRMRPENRPLVVTWPYHVVSIHSGRMRPENQGTSPHEGSQVSFNPLRTHAPGESAYMLEVFAPLYVSIHSGRMRPENPFHRNPSIFSRLHCGFREYPIRRHTIPMDPSFVLYKSSSYPTANPPTLQAPLEVRAENRHPLDNQWSFQIKRPSNAMMLRLFPGVLLQEIKSKIVLLVVDLGKQASP